MNYWIEMKTKEAEEREKYQISQEKPQKFLNPWEWHVNKRRERERGNVPRRVWWKERKRLTRNGVWRHIEVTIFKGSEGKKQRSKEAEKRRNGRRKLRLRRRKSLLLWMVEFIEQNGTDKSFEGKRGNKGRKRSGEGNGRERRERGRRVDYTSLPFINIFSLHP